MRHKWSDGRVDVTFGSIHWKQYLKLRVIPLLYIQPVLGRLVRPCKVETFHVALWCSLTPLAKSCENLLVKVQNWLLLYIYCPRITQIHRGAMIFLSLNYLVRRTSSFCFRRFVFINKWPSTQAVCFEQHVVILHTYCVDRIKLHLHLTNHFRQKNFHKYFFLSIYL